MLKRWIAAGLAAWMIAGLMAGCARITAPSSAGEAPARQTASRQEALPEEEATLLVAGGWPDCRALELVASAFGEKYPNCTVTYEYLQDYYPSLEKRMGGEAPVDLFFTSNIQADSAMLPYAQDLNSCQGLDLSNTFSGLIENFTFRGESSGAAPLYAIPVGAELRGMFVNKTLLGSLGLEVPANQAELLAACQALKDNGYIPFHGNPGAFAQTLIYPWICNLIANADDPQATYQSVNKREPGVSQLFLEPYQFLYGLVEKGYYDYKKAQTELDLFNETAEADYARYFLNIRRQGDTYIKADDLGQVAFMPSPMSLSSVIEKTKDDYHSQIEYAFLLAPVGVDGGYAYMSPAHGIAINKASAQMDWCVKFLDFLFQPENNKLFAKAFNAVPNTKEAFGYIRTLFTVPDSHISHLGQVTFSYGFYDALIPSMTDVSKANNPKYMRDDGAGNLSLYPLTYYMQALEESIQQQ